MAQTIKSSLLQTGVDIPFYEASLFIHQPTIKELSVIGGEETMYLGCEFLSFTKESLTDTNLNLESVSDLEIILSSMKDIRAKDREGALSAQSLLMVLFPDYDIFYESKYIKFIHRTTKLESVLTDENYKKLVNILSCIFCLEKSSDKKYNPSGSIADKIAKKLQAREKKLNEIKSNKEDNRQKLKELDLFDRYISILAVGLRKDKNELSNYTVYQLFDEFKRFELNEQYKLQIKARLAGSQDEQEFVEWRKNMYSEKE